MMALFSRALHAVVLLTPFLTSLALAGASHTGKVDLSLNLVDEAGSAHSVYQNTVDFSLNWATAKCELRIPGQKFAFCNLDTAQDLKSRESKILVKAMPIAHFSVDSVTALLSYLGKQDSQVRDGIDQVLLETASARMAGFDLPFYSCENCDSSRDEKTVILNAYESFVSNSTALSHPALKGKKLVLKMTLHHMQAFGGAFNTIGDNNAGNFGSH